MEWIIQSSGHLTIGSDRSSYSWEYRMRRSHGRSRSTIDSETNSIIPSPLQQSLISMDFFSPLFGSPPSVGLLRRLGSHSISLVIANRWTWSTITADPIIFKSNVDWRKWPSISTVYWIIIGSGRLNFNACDYW